MTTGTETVDEVVQRVAAWFSRRFDRLTGLATQLIDVTSLDADGHIEITDATRKRLKSVAVRFLAEDETIDGCGLIIAQSALGTEVGDLEWWVREEESRFARYSFGVVPGADRYYDYSHHEWFTRAFIDGETAVVGPYIDYLGVEAYVVTITVPAEIDGVRIGAVGNDIQVADLEAALLPELLRTPAEIALVGARGTVLFGTSSTFVSGDYVAPELDGFRSVAVGPAGAGLRIVAPAH